MKRMNERLIVKNFLCLKDIDIEVKDFLILIGPQAAGKSLCAKLLYFFRTVCEDTRLSPMVSALGGELPDFALEFSGKFEAFFPKTYWGGQEFCIEYGSEGKKLCTIRRNKNSKLELNFDQDFLTASQKIKPPLQKFFENNPEKLKEILNKVLSSRPRPTSPRLIMDIFIPAGRAFFSLLQKNIFRFLRTSNTIDPFLVEFGTFYEDVKQTGYAIPMEAQTLIRSILKGEYIPSENLLVLADGKKVALELLSSGQQETLPLALVLAYIISSRLDPYRFFNIYVEEPEAHLFPDAQEQMSRLISFLQYNAEHKVTFVITTHSPYMLAAFNNLIKAGNIVKQNPCLQDAVCKEIPESMHIDIERFSAYSLKDGRAVSIIDKENNLINADAIDGVSESIMEIFNTLLDIEFEGGEAGENV
jgi:energy-coupling factor transporter ATP-binding protein EcfA2